MSSFVVDASVTLAWCFEDERTSSTEVLLDRMRAGEEVLVPGHWPLEVLNSLVHAKKRSRIGEEQIVRFLRDLASFRIMLDREQGPEVWGRIRSLSEEYRLTAYDAAYLELGGRSKLPIATLDRDLLRAARSASVALVDVATIET